MLCCAAPALARSKHRKKRAPVRRTEVLVIGSSSINGAFGKRIDKDLSGSGFKIHRFGKSSAGLARPDFFDWHKQIARMPIGKATRAAVVYLGTNDGQAIWLRPGERKKLRYRGKWLRWGAKQWEPVYQARVKRFARALCKAGVPRVAFITPVDTTDPDLLKRLNIIRRLQYQGARSSRCAWAFSGRGDRRALHSLPRLASGKRLRHKDGFHMTERGATLAWTRLRPRVVRYMNKPIAKQRRRTGRTRTRSSRASDRRTARVARRHHRPAGS